MKSTVMDSNHIRNSFTSAKLTAADRKKYVWTLVYM